MKTIVAFTDATRVVRETLALSSVDPSAAIVHALSSAGFLDLEHRSPAADTSLTELEQQADAWDRSCERARQVAAGIREQLAHHPSVQRVQVDGDRLLVALYNVTPPQWTEWCAYFGIRDDRETELPYAVAADGYRDGVRVSVVAYDLPVAREHARGLAARAYDFQGVVYDLAVPQRDCEGQVWFYRGMRTADGMPLLSLDGRPERCTLANIVRMTGPLTPVTDTMSSQATPVMTGGESA
ncbi:BN159_2729 family protein [Streptomyces griseoviridis]|uniref:BN159_2729 family protein n=1 Tax=Streptomyces griseoviridis TaxID=45398 RepID=UPI00344DBE22